MGKVLVIILSFHYIRFVRSIFAFLERGILRAIDPSKSWKLSCSDLIRENEGQDLDSDLEFNLTLFVLFSIRLFLINYTTLRVVFLKL